MNSLNNTGIFFRQLVAVIMMPLLFTLVVAMLPVLIIVYSLVINLRNFVNWLVYAALVVGDE